MVAMGAVSLRKGDEPDVNDCEDPVAFLGAVRAVN